MTSNETPAEIPNSVSDSEDSSNQSTSTQNGCRSRSVISTNTSQASEEENTCLRSTKTIISPSEEESNISSAEDTSNGNVLTIRCNDIVAELYRTRFGSGGRGRCIRYNNSWYTPNKFQAKCGRASSKDWKRSIRFENRSLGSLIQEGVLLPHATSCTCSSCCDDVSAYGPIRFYSPYKRKRKSDEHEQQKIQKVDTMKDQESTSDTNSKNMDSDTGDSSTASDDQNLSLSSGVKSNDSIASDINRILRHFDRMNDQLEDLTSEFKDCREEAGVILTELVTMTSDSPPAIRLVPGAKKKCENCNHDCETECSLCRNAPYCSDFCIRKDWPQHRLSCRAAKPDKDEECKVEE